MVRTGSWLALAMLVGGCYEHGSTGPDVQHMDAGNNGSDGAVVRDGSSGGSDAANAVCPNGVETKIKFTQSNGCGNDGGVEFCAPANDALVQIELMAISASIHCAPGGGRAGCMKAPNLVLCSYPTTFPTNCVTPKGAMSDGTWSDMCSIAGLDQIVEIVPTIVE